MIKIMMIGFSFLLGAAESMAQDVDAIVQNVETNAQNGEKRDRRAGVRVRPVIPVTQEDPEVMSARQLIEDLNKRRALLSKDFHIFWTNLKKMKQGQPFTKEERQFNDYVYATFVAIGKASNALQRLINLVHSPHSADYEVERNKNLSVIKAYVESINTNEAYIRSTMESLSR